MQGKITHPINITLVAILFFALVLLNNQLFSSVRLDLTENQVYSLSSGSREILKDIEEPINLYFFYSDKASKSMTSLRNYANRVESLLQEYANAANGKIRLQVIDPEPFSEAEDQAAQFGLTAATIGVAGDAIYMGLAATNALDDQETIAFFDPQKEAFLEYDISKLIHQLSEPEPVKVTLLTDVNLSGGQNPMTGQFDPAWTFYTQLEQLYQVEQIGSDAAALPDETDVLMLVHPKNLSDELLYAIDQFAMNGGKVLAFVDPHFESDASATMMGGMGAMGPNTSNIDKLLQAYGVQFNSEEVVLDALAGLEIRTPSGGIARHMGILGLGAEQLDRKDVTTSGLEVVNGSSFGAFSKLENSSVSFLPLLRSSVNTDLVNAMTYSMTRDPEQLAKDFANENTRYVLAARIGGKASSAFAESTDIELGAEHVGETSNLNMILVADADLLADRFWVQQANFFGQTIFTPFANNGDLITNAVENLGGSDALISVRSRGTFARPFTRVDELTIQAEARFREQEQLLQQELDETERQLTELQGQQGDNGMLVLSPEQQQAVDAFLQKKIEIRQKLREVRHQLDKDIESLGNWLKFMNIAVAPLLLMLVLLILRRLLRKQAKGTLVSLANTVDKSEGAA